MNKIKQRQLKKKLDILCTLRNCKKHSDIVKHLSDDVVQLICESVQNVIYSSRVTGNQAKKLFPYKNTLEYIAKPKNSFIKKKKMLFKQKGSGFMETLLNIAIPIISSLIAL